MAHCVPRSWVNVFVILYLMTTNLIKQEFISVMQKACQKVCQKVSLFCNPFRVVDEQVVDGVAAGFEFGLED